MKSELLSKTDINISANYKDKAHMASSVACGPTNNIYLFRFLPTVSKSPAASLKSNVCFM